MRIGSWIGLGSFFLFKFGFLGGVLTLFAYLAHGIAYLSNTFLSRVGSMVLGDTRHRSRNHIRASRKMCLR